MTEWKKTGEYTSITDVILRKTGRSETELQNPVPMEPNKLENIALAVKLITDAIKDKIPFVIVGDYDADGITSVTILVKLLCYFGVKPKVIIPKRFTDGYGISGKLIEGIENSFIVTVDNGIVAHDAIAKARSNGNTVLIIDHHLPEDSLPFADLIVDPYIHPQNNQYVNFCGAGLAYELSMAMLAGESMEKMQELVNDITVLACIGTLADVILLLDESRRIVIDGLKIANDKRLKLSAGIRSVLDLAGYPIDEESITYKIAPTINAAGRLFDAGSMFVLRTLCSTDKNHADESSRKMKEINERRKELVNEHYPLVLEEAEKQQDKSILVLYIPSVPEGLVGILTGKIAEAYHRPSFVFTDTSRDRQLIKSSGRSYGGFDLSLIVDSVKTLCEAAGGHQGAAGISCRRKLFEAVREQIWASGNGISPNIADNSFYDIEIKEEESAEMLNTIKRFAPFGEGVAKPKLVIREFVSETHYASTYDFIGKSKEHLKLYGKNINVIGFNLAEKFSNLGCPIRLNLLGTLGENSFNGSTSIQFILEDIAISQGENQIREANL